MGPRVCRVRVPALRRVLGTHAAAQVGHVTRVPAHALRHHPVPGRRVLQVAVPPLPLVHVPPVGHAHGAVHAWTHVARVTLLGFCTRYPPRLSLVSLLYSLGSSLFTEDIVRVGQHVSLQFYFLFHRVLLLIVIVNEARNVTFNNIHCYTCRGLQIIILITNTIHHE